jgi:hypothetical protein
MPPSPPGTKALQTLSFVQTLQLIPCHPSSHSHVSPCLGGRSLPLSSDPHKGSVQSSPPHPGGHEQVTVEARWTIGRSLIVEDLKGWIGESRAIERCMACSSSGASCHGNREDVGGEHCRLNGGEVQVERWLPRHDSEQENRGV